MIVWMRASEFSQLRDQALMIPLGSTFCRFSDVVSKNRLLKGGRGRVFVIVPLIIVSVHLFLLLYPFTCDQVQFCVPGEASEGSTGSLFI